MKFRKFVMLVFAVMLLAAYSSVVAQDEMPQMGPTEEIKALNWLVGEWNVVQEFQMAPGADWQKSEATAIYSYSIDGFALEMDYTSNMMGMKYVGKLVETYDRVLSQYQTIWVDNLSGRMSYYTGRKVADSTILSGTEVMPDGSEVLSRVLTYNETPTAFNWHIDMSFDGGKTFVIGGKAKYTKK